MSVSVYNYFVGDTPEWAVNERVFGTWDEAESYRKEHGFFHVYQTTSMVAIADLQIISYKG